MTAPAVLALAKAIELATLAAEAAVAAGRISNLLQQRAAAGEELTQDDLVGLFADREIARMALAASIAKRQASGT